MPRRKKPSLLQRLFICFKEQKEEVDIVCTRNKLVGWHSKRLSVRQGRPSNSPVEPIPLATWPGQQLHSTLESVIVQENISVESQQISTVRQKVESELQELCPFEVKEQYDFCLICSEHDSVEAEELTKDLSTRFNLLGHLVWNSVFAGADQFSVFEDVIERSSVVIFYITKKFIEDEFCCHIARNKLVSPAERCGVIRDIPLLMDPDVILPESLRLVHKLTLHYVAAQFPKIFTDRIQLEKIERQVQYEMQIDNKRLSLMKEIVRRVSIS